MERFLKPARANYGRRGYFSYITESAIHLLGLVSNVLALSKVKHLICTRSNVSAFIILANSKLKYTILK